MADQGDKQRARHQKRTSKKRVTTRSRSRNNIAHEVELSDSDNTIADIVDQSNNNLEVSSDSKSVSAESCKSEDSSASADNLKRKHPDNLEKQSVKKTKETSIKEKKTRAKAKTSKGKSKMSSSSSQSFNESADNSISDVGSDINILNAGVSEFSSTADAAFDTANNEKDGDADDSMFSSEANVIIYSGSAYSVDSKESQDKSLNNSSSSSPNSLVRPESEPSPDILLPVNSEESNEIREILRKQIISIRNTIGDNIFSSRSKKHGSQQRKKILNSEKKIDSSSDESNSDYKVKILNLGSSSDESNPDYKLKTVNLGLDGKSDPNDSHPMILMDDFDYESDIMAGAGSSQDSELPRDSGDSSQVVKLNSTFVSKRTRHHASSSSKNSDTSAKTSRNSEEFLSGSLVAALDAADAVASFASSSQSSSTASGGVTANDSGNKDSDLGRLQSLLEARGIPLHVFGALGHRMQHLIHRTMGSSSNSRVQQLLQGLQATGDEGRQLQALVEMCQLLVMGNEDTLVGFPVKQVVPVLINLLSMEHNFEMMNNACRALTYLMEALPRSSSVVVDAVPVFLNKIQVIQCMDVAEQSLTALEMLSKWHNKPILHAKGVSICLTYLDFFSINSQRSALSIIANCFQNLLPNEFSFVHESLPILSSWLSRQDEKSVESICLAFSRLVESFQYDTKYLKEIASQNLLSNILELLLLSPTILSTHTFTTIMRMLALICASCPELAILLLNLNIAETLCYLLIGNSDNYDIKLTPRSHQELLEISFLICELMPCLPTSGIFSIDSVVMKHKNRKKDFVIWKWKDDSGTWQSYSVSDSKLIETAYQSGVDTFRHTEETSSGESVTTILDLNSLQQISGDTNTKRPLKRCLSSFSDALLQNSGANSSDKPTVKVDHFKENSELVNNCIKALFPVLYEIYCSSAGPSVRYNCLRAMLRMIYFAPPSVLELVLKSQMLSRNIAAMLASADLKVLVSTLQMAHLLIEKLPEVFGVHFIREGVMHEIRTLAKIDISSRISETPMESLTFSSNILRSGSSLLSSSKSFELISSLQSSSQDFSLQSSSSTKGPKREIVDRETGLTIKIADPNKKQSTKDKDVPKKESPSGQCAASCSVMSDKYEKVNSWIREMAKKFEDFIGIETFEASHPTVNVLNQLTSTVAELAQNSDNGYKALCEICNIMTEKDVSSFELIHSGLVKNLFSFLTVPPKSSQQELLALEERLRTFLNVFIGAPLQRSNFDVTTLNPSPLIIIIDKLNSCISHLEQFPVKVHDISTRSFSRRGTSALRFFNTHHLKCVFQRHPECTNLRQWRGGPVMIDPLASIHNIDQYLVGQGYATLKSEDDDDEEEVEEEEEDEDDDEDDSDQSDNSDENMIDIGAALRLNPNQESQKLQFLIGQNVLPSNMTIYQAVKQYSNNNEGHSSENHEAESEDPLGLSNIWTKTHTIFYRPLPPGSPETNTSNSEVVVLTRSKTEKKKKQASEHTTPPKKGNKKEEQKTEKIKDDMFWNDGIVPEVNPLLCFVTSIPESSAIEDPSLEVIYLLRVIHMINNLWGMLYQINSWERAVSLSLFINQKLTLKANRQLQDLISVMTGNVPAWLSFIAQEFPFLFPFQTRYLIFYVSTFDKDRALQRVIDVMPEVKTNDRITPKFDKRKKTITRDSLLKQAESVLQDVGNSKVMLEIQYKNEVGTGLGPTLEFYALISKEMQRADLDMWRGDKTVAQNGKGVPTNYVYNPVGLFPLPLPRNAKQSTLTKVCNKFKLLGTLLAKSVMDSRLMDIPLSLTFYKWILSQENNLTLSDIKYIDESFAETVFKLEKIVTRKNELEKEFAHDASALKSALDNLTFDGCPLEDLNLDFTLPGFPNVEMKKGGKDMIVNIYNLEQYLKLVKHWMMKEGVMKQMKSFREGFESVFPIKNLRIFYPDELELLFCGSEHAKWDVQTLMDCCRSDHGYTHESRAIQFLFNILSSYDKDQQRQFLQFITGSPRLPVGGLKSLSPPLTIVKKTSDDCKDTDNHLPSVMTCVNYLKLPDYSTIEIMREKLDIAVSEGQHSFHLS